jgi:hypothetical protein
MLLLRMEFRKISFAFSYLLLLYWEKVW